MRNKLNEKLNESKINVFNKLNFMFERFSLNIQ